MSEIKLRPQLKYCPFCLIMPVLSFNPANKNLPMLVYHSVNKCCLSGKYFSQEEWQARPEPIPARVVDYQKLKDIAVLWRFSKDVDIKLIIDFIDTAMKVNQSEWLLTEPKNTDRELLIKYTDSLRAYMRESSNNIGFDERESEEFVDIFLTEPNERNEK